MAVFLALVIALAAFVAVGAKAQDADAVATAPSEGAAEEGAIDSGLPGERVPDGTFTIGVFGDSLAEGIWGSLYRALQRDNRFEVLRRSRHSTGVARPDYYDWPAELERFLEEDPLDAVVFSIGLNDMQSMFVPGGSHHRFRSEDWDQAYRERVARLMALLDAADVPTYWVGLPIMRSGNYSENIAHLNSFFGDIAADHNVEFVPMWDLTVDEAGQYSSYLPDESGRTRLMRANDGIHFTPRGYDILGNALLARMAEDLAVFQMDQSE